MSVLTAIQTAIQTVLYKLTDTAQSKMVCTWTHRSRTASGYCSNKLPSLISPWVTVSKTCKGWGSIQKADSQLSDTTSWQHSISAWRYAQGKQEKRQHARFLTLTCNLSMKPPSPVTSPSYSKQDRKSYQRLLQRKLEVTDLPTTLLEQEFECFRLWIVTSCGSHTSLLNFHIKL